jgi:hypothetical protein
MIPVNRYLRLVPQRVSVGGMVIKLRFQHLDSIASDSRMTDELEKDLEGSDRGVICLSELRKITNADISQGQRLGWGTAAFRKLFINEHSRSLRLSLVIVLEYLGYKIILKLFSNFCCYSLQYFLSFTAQ